MSNTLRDSVWDRHGIIANMLADIQMPKMVKVKQLFDKEKLADIPSVIRQELAKKEIASTIKPGQKIAITVGSRGIRNIALMTREVVNVVRSYGADPFIIPSMGSHGGATAQGQRELIESFGVTEDYVGAPIRATMDVVEIGYTEHGKLVVIDKFAAEADGIIVMGRVKPHTAFHGKYESGLCKMMAIGLGKQKGAENCHEDGFKHMARNVPAFAQVVMKNCNILFGLAILENAYDETCKVLALPKHEIASKEPELLREAKKQMPQIKFPQFDVLIVDQIGKNFSGDGMDPNITATYCTPYASGGPEIQRCVVLDVSEESHGNTIGIGLAHFTTKRLFDKTDFDAVYPNALTCTVALGARMPMVLKNDKSAIAAAIYTCNEIDKIRPRIVRIKNSLHIDELYISEALMPEAEAHPEIEIAGAPFEWEFDEEGNL